MALQLLYSSWWENETEHSILRTSVGLSDEDIAYIMRVIGITDSYDALPSDEENEDLANTLYLHLPSSAKAIVRTGQYTVKDSDQIGNVIVHAYIHNDVEEITPLLYAINNCFRQELTLNDQQVLLAMDYLPETPFPRAQFKLNQAEIRKFFSRGRLRTLACLLQAVIDSHNNERLIILKDSYPSLKYWFFGIYCCLPVNRTQDLTYSTYAYQMPEGCKLVCPAPGHSMDFEALAEEGHFIIDNLDNIGSSDIESAKFAKSIVQDFWEDLNMLPEMLEGIEELMKAYNLNVATAAGMYKLVCFDFEWFESTHEIHYYLGKIGTIDKNSLEMISHKLWEAFSTPGFKFELNTDNLPILSYMFRNTNDDVRWEIIRYIDSHKYTLGYHKCKDFDELYKDFSDKLSFVAEFLPLDLMQKNTLRTYCDERNCVPNESATFFCIIVDNYFDYIELLGFEELKEHAIYLLERILHANELELAFRVCQSASKLPFDFLRYVLVQGVLNDSNSSEDTATKLHLPDTFTYRIARLLIEKDATLALELVKNHARKGKYRDSTLALYNDLCRDFPDETAEFDETLRQKTVYADFVTDSVFHKFASLSNATREELTDFFTTYYVTGQDRNHYFETKLLQHLNSHFPVLSIEMADYFLKLLSSVTKSFRKYTLSGMLCSFILHQNAVDIFDYYHNAVDEFEERVAVLRAISPTLSPQFNFATLAIAVSVALNKNDEAIETESQKIFHFLTTVSYGDIIKEFSAKDSFGHFYTDKLLRYSEKLAPNPHLLTELINKAVYPLYQTENGKYWFKAVWRSRTAIDPTVLYPITARLGILSQQTNDAELKDLLYKVTNTLSQKSKREQFVTWLRYAENEEELSALKSFLFEAWRRSFSRIRRIFIHSDRKLFGKHK